MRFMGSERVGHDWVTELNWTEAIYQAGEETKQNKTKLGHKAQARNDSESKVLWWVSDKGIRNESEMNLLGTFGSKISATLATFRRLPLSTLTIWFYFKYTFKWCCSSQWKEGNILSPHPWNQLVPSNGTYPSSLGRRNLTSVEKPFKICFIFPSIKCPFYTTLQCFKSLSFLDHIKLGDITKLTHSRYQQIC